MITATATATEMQNNFGRYLSLVMSGQEIIVTKNGREVGRFIPKAAAVSYLTDSRTGILKEEYDLNEARAESMRAKYGSIDWHQYCSGCTAESIRVCKRLCNDLETV